MPRPDIVEADRSDFSKRVTAVLKQVVGNLPQAAIVAVAERMPIEFLEEQLLQKEKPTNIVLVLQEVDELTEVAAQELGILLLEWPGLPAELVQRIELELSKPSILAKKLRDEPSLRQLLGQLREERRERAASVHIKKKLRGAKVPPPEESGLHVKLVSLKEGNGGKPHFGGWKLGKLRIVASACGSVLGLSDHEHLALLKELVGEAGLASQPEIVAARIRQRLKLILTRKEALRFTLLEVDTSLGLASVLLAGCCDLWISNLERVPPVARFSAGEPAPWGNTKARRLRLTSGDVLYLLPRGLGEGKPLQDLMLETALLHRDLIAVLSPAPGEEVRSKGLMVIPQTRNGEKL